MMKLSPELEAIEDARLSAGLPFVLSSHNQPGVVENEPSCQRCWWPGLSPAVGILLSLDDAEPAGVSACPAAHWWLCSFGHTWQRAEEPDGCSHYPQPGTEIAVASKAIEVWNGQQDDGDLPPLDLDADHPDCPHCGAEPTAIVLSLYVQPENVSGVAPEPWLHWLVCSGDEHLWRRQQPPVPDTVENMMPDRLAHEPIPGFTFPEPAPPQPTRRQRRLERRLNRRLGGGTRTLATLKGQSR